MRQVLVFVTLISVLCSGCDNRQQSENEKLDALLHRVDVIYSNQCVLCTNQLVMASRLAALPKMPDINAMVYYYHTNAIDCIDTDLGKNIRFYATNMMALQIHGQEVLLRERLDDLTNPSPIQSSSQEDQIAQDVIQVNLRAEDLQNDVDDLKTELDKIKTRLGIMY